MAASGRAGTCAIFHCDLMHASEHNLSHRDHRQAYFRFNTCFNRPREAENPRADYVCSRNWAPMELTSDASVLASKTALA